MLRRPVNDTIPNDVWNAIPFKNDKEKFRITKELERNRKRRGIRVIEIDDRNNNIIYSHRMEDGAFH